MSRTSHQKRAMLTLLRGQTSPPDPKDLAGHGEEAFFRPMAFWKWKDKHRVRTSFQMAMMVAMFSFLCSARVKVEQDKPVPVRLTKEGRKWVEQTLKAQSLEDKVGQMLQIRYYVDYKSFEDQDYQHLREQLQKYHIG